MSILHIFEAGLQKAVNKETINKFGLKGRGDRIGSSDIGGCLRKSYLDKVKRLSPSIENIIRMQRGNIAENMVHKALQEANVEFFEQVHIKSDLEPFSATIDFLIKEENELNILEVKTVSSMVEEPYQNWILQVAFQEGILRENYPNLEINSFVLAIDVNSGWYEVFHIETNPTIFSIALAQAKDLKESIDTKIEPKAEMQLYCSSCEYKINCPIMGKIDISEDEISPDIKYLIKEVKGLKEVDKIKKSKEKELKETIEAMNIKRLLVDEINVSLVTVNGKASFDTKGLQTENGELFNKYSKQGKSYSYLKVS